MKKTKFSRLFLLPPIAAYLFLALNFNFLQDDAYISFRYVANFLNGDGLVFNIGERVEGFTNFGWIIYLIVWGKLGFDYILVSKITGILFGAGLIFVTYLTAARIFQEQNKWLAFLPAYFLGASAALAYWSQAGLESSAFAFFAALAIYFYLCRSRWLILAIALAIWIRPEGALLAGLLVLTETIVNRRMPQFSIFCAVSAFILSLPLVYFKYIYYGSILPNPYYAKTGWTAEQLLAGLEYAGTFFQQYGFYGAGLVLALVFFRKLSTNAGEILLLALFYTLYIIIIGGDVLKVHRFFLPIFGLAAIINIQVLQILFEKLTQKTRILMIIATALPLLIMTYMLPRAYINNYADREQGLTYVMQTLAQDIKATGAGNMTVAVSTIGVFSYELLGHTVIDMLGLTDSTIARHPQEPIDALATTWRERKFNATYVLNREPDYIVFSTGDKPSAPAEQALLLYAQFLESYISVDWYHINPKYAAGRILLPAFKKVRPVSGQIAPTYPPQYVGMFKRGREFYSAGQFDDALLVLDSATAVSPRRPYKYLLYYKAMCNFKLENHDLTKSLLLELLSQDSLVYDAHKYLYYYARIENNLNAAARHESVIKNVAPWSWPVIESEANRIVSGVR